MRLAVIIMALLAFAASSPALAKSDKIPPGQAASQGHQGTAPENPGNAHGTDQGKSGAGGGSDQAPKPDKTGTGGGSDHTPKPDIAQPTTDEPVDQDDALRAVEEREALPLVRIVMIAKEMGAGRLVNARLVRIHGVLVYQLTLIDDAGRSRRDYYDARTGYPVDLN